METMSNPKRDDPEVVRRLARLARTRSYDLASMSATIRQRAKYAAQFEVLYPLLLELELEGPSHDLRRDFDELRSADDAHYLVLARALAKRIVRRVTSAHPTPRASKLSSTGQAC